ncbi:aminotransferase class IV [Streptomyces solicathayae]|uniref:Aminotransferase class IV n=1 Tax=Streptomyces solicathayae TaxID=3081768 RepID=A0ABZ0LYB6_9ACTN|nr:aminotransferase class IV [Streptomyces sp. HUAS YS2]WOX24505.1 aminotransferase class IV [Streptomyces sp. HUAS YS2]
MTIAPVHIEIDGIPAPDPALTASLMSGYGHFTAMQVCDGRVRGLALHLARLDGAHQELFGAGLDAGRIRMLTDRALRGSGRRDASVRVYGYEDALVVTVREPFTPDPSPQLLMSVPYVRPAAHLKHLGGFGQAYHRQAAARAGFDEALLTGPDGAVAEGAITNVAFWDGERLVWPSAPHLTGVTMALLTRRLPCTLSPVTLADLPSFRACLVTNSRGIAPVTRIDRVPYPVDEALMARVEAAYEQVPWDPIG